MTTPTQEPVASTVPAAVILLEAIFTKVAAAAAQSKKLNVGVFLGRPVQTVPNYFLAVGDVGTDTSTGSVLTAYSATPKGLYGPGAVTREENYSIACTLRAFSGEVDPVKRLTEAFDLLGAVIGALNADPKGSGGDPRGYGALSTDGAWLIGATDVAWQGPTDQGGWGVILRFDVDVVHATVSSLPLY